MLFITNRAITGGIGLEVGRKISFDMSNNLSSQSVYFCRRNGKGDYTEVGSLNFMAELKKSNVEQILIYIHGFSNLPEPDIFPRAAALQGLFDKKQEGLVLVVPLIWPCDDDPGIIKDYWDDQKSADASAFAFARVLEKFMAWRTKAEVDDKEAPCLKRINILAHSMGNRVLRQTLETWASYDRGGEVPLLFRNTFLVAADIVNESLERGKTGDYICQSSRNVSVYFASDDLALRSSKVSNLKNKVASRRLGHTGPENMELVPNNVYAVDCDDINTKYDYPKGHSYFLYDERGEKKKKTGLVFEHIFDSIKRGRVSVDDPLRRVHVLK